MAPRGRASASRSRGVGDGAILAAQRAIDKDDEYKRSVIKLQAMACSLAERHLRAGSDMEGVLKESGGEAGEDFLLQCRNRLKAIAEGNAKRMYEIDYFVEAVKDVKSQVERRQNESEGAEHGIDTDSPNYEHSINDALEKAREQGEADEQRVPLEEHALSIALRTKLGEKVQKKRSRASRGGDDDDDLEVVNDNNIDDVHKLKCPITGMLFEDPVTNKVCGHTYSRAGLMQMVQNRKKNCPVPGCANNRCSLEQVEDDEEMKMKVRTYKTRQQAVKRQRDLEDDDDDQGNNGYTVIH